MPQWLIDLLPQIASDIAAIIAAIVAGNASSADMDRLHALTAVESAAMAYREVLVSVKLAEMNKQS